jgi:Xaa-Pro aminopeptidase
MLPPCDEQHGEHGQRVETEAVVVLQEGVVFAVEPLIWMPGVSGGGGVRLEDTLLVTAEAGAASAAPAAMRGSSSTEPHVWLATRLSPMCG